MDTATNFDKEAKIQGPSKTAVRLKMAREWHLYLGTLFAPSIIFFALSGSLQLFGLHEGHPGEAYQPPAWDPFPLFQRFNEAAREMALSCRSIAAELPILLPRPEPVCQR